MLQNCQTLQNHHTLILSPFVAFSYVFHFQQNPSATNAALDEDGWFNTGDIGWLVPSHARGRSRNCGGMLVLEGRVKDTIVLSTGY